MVERTSESQTRCAEARSMRRAVSLARRRMLAASVLGSVPLRRVFAAGLKRDEQVLLFPSTARRLESGNWLARVEAWVHELERRPGTSQLLARYIGLDLDELSLLERARYMTRTQLFRVDSERGRILQIQFGSQPPIDLPASQPNGRTSAQIEVAAEPGQAGWLDYKVLMPALDARRFVGRVLAVPAKGLSIVSDVDDTIKHTEVRDRHEMLLNTFARQFAAVPGMAEWLLRCTISEPSVTFHYVSGSPHQLYPAIAQFLEANNFPSGTVHLRTVDIARELFGAEPRSQTHKIAVISQLLQDFPERGFVLIGDSAELDPEIYGEIARTYPDRVHAVLIRDATREGHEAARYASAMRDVPRRSWRVFETPDELPDRF